MPHDPDPVARWVARLNKLGREMGDIAASMHPSAWREQLAPYRERYRKLAGAGPKPESKPVPIQLRFPLDLK